MSSFKASLHMYSTVHCLYPGVTSESSGEGDVQPAAQGEGKPIEGASTMFFVGSEVLLKFTIRLKNNMWKLTGADRVQKQYSLIRESITAPPISGSNKLIQPFITVLYW